MKFKKILCILTMLLCLTGCGEKVLDKEEITVYHATDFHYLSQQLTENSPRFVEYIASGDGKMTHCIEAITEAFISEVTAEKPDYLLITGDITFNGEKQSHIDFSQKLKRIEQAGVQVLVIPGNHDVDYPFAYAYNNDMMSRTDRITREEYAQLYGDFGLNQAYSKDEETYSYLYRLNKNVVLLALDCNTRGTGRVPDRTVEWVEKELSKLGEDTTVITATHQTLFDHFSGNMNAAKYAVYNSEKLIEVLKNKNVPFNLCGHIHTQHIYRDDVITDIATESISVTPFNYGVVKITPDTVEYTTKSTDVEQWAKQTGSTEENLVGFSEYALDFYMKNQSRLAMARMEDYTFPDEEKQLMADFFAEINTYYFPGTIDDGYEYLCSTPGYRMWCEKGESLGHYKYIMSRMEEGKSGVDHNRRKKDLQQ